MNFLGGVYSHGNMESIYFISIASKVIIKHRFLGLIQRVTGSSTIDYSTISAQDLLIIVTASHSG